MSSSSSSPTSPLPPIPNVLSVLDFDGTLTQVPGKELVFTPFYQGLLDKEHYPSPDEANNYLLPMKSNCKDLIRQAFTSTDARSVTTGALAYLKMSTGFTNATTLIISRNQRQYITALLELGGLTPEQISRIQIYDVHKMGVMGKGGVLLSVLSADRDVPFTHILAYDDYAKDMEEVKVVIQSFGFPDTYCFQSKPWEFEWSLHTRTITDLCMGSSVIHKKRKTADEENDDRDPKTWVHRREYAKVLAENMMLKKTVDQMRLIMEKAGNMLQGALKSPL